MKSISLYQYEINHHQTDKIKKPDTNPEQIQLNIKEIEELRNKLRKQEYIERDNKQEEG